jgi:hypothetical protein
MLNQVVLQHPPTRTRSSPPSGPPRPARPSFPPLTRSGRFTPRVCACCRCCLGPTCQRPVPFLLPQAESPPSSFPSPPVTTAALVATMATQPPPGPSGAPTRHPPPLPGYKAKPQPPFPPLSHLTVPPFPSHPTDPIPTTSCHRCCVEEHR